MASQWVATPPPCPVKQIFDAVKQLIDAVKQIFDGLGFWLLGFWPIKKLLLKENKKQNIFFMYIYTCFCILSNSYFCVNN